MSHPLSTAGHVESRARTNTHYAKAIENVPGYIKAMALRDKAQARKRETLFPLVVWPTAPTDLDADLDQYLAAYTAAFEEEQTRARTADALDTVIGACARQMRSAIDNPDTLLAVLASDLDQLMKRVDATVARLKGASSPTEAIDNGTADVWRELPALRREYDSIRAAQTLVLIDDPAMNKGSDHLDDPVASDVILRNLDEVLPAWREPDTRFTMQGSPPDRRPWPSDPVEQLVWLSASAAQVWLPTSTELAKLHTERRHRIDPPAQGEPGNLMTDVTNRPLATSSRRTVRVIG